MHYNMHTNNYHDNKTYNDLPNNQHGSAIASFQCYKFEHIYDTNSHIYIQKLIWLDKSFMLIFILIQ